MKERASDDFTVGHKQLHFWNWKARRKRLDIIEKELGVSTTPRLPPKPATRMAWWR